MTKLLIITTIQRTLRDFLLPYGDYFRSLGWQVDAMSNIRDPFPVAEEHFDHFWPVDWGRNPLDLHNFIHTPKKIREIVQREGYDIVHVHTPVAAFITRFALRKMRAAGKVKVIYTAHGFHFYKGNSKIKNSLFIVLEKLAGQWTDHLIVINREDYNAALKYGIAKKDNLTLMPGIGVDLAKFLPVDSNKKHQLRQKFNFTDKDFLLIFAGELNSNKNQSFLIKSMKEIKQVIPNAILLLPGKGAMNIELQNLIHEMNLAEHVKLLGHRDDIPELIAMSDIGTSASIREGLGLNVLEYLSCGLPVVVSNNRGHREIVTNDKNGYLYNLSDQHSYTALITKLYKKKELYHQLSMNARSSIKKFTLKNTIQIIDNIYKRYV